MLPHLVTHIQASPGPKALMTASMVRLPLLATAGSDSFLYKLVESNVPLATFGSETVKAIM